MSGQVLLLQSNCGQMRFQPGDRVTFCLPKACFFDLARFELLDKSHVNLSKRASCFKVQLHVPNRFVTL